MTILDKLCPNLVGVDVGCQMTCIKLPKGTQIEPEVFLEACKKTYKQKQIDFIRRFYNKILMKNLKDYFPANEIDKIIAEEGWVKDKEYIIPNERNASPEFNVAKEIEDIKYINDMNVQFNKLIKEHEHLVTFLNSQPSAK